MKRIIEGKTYNTDTALLVCDTSNGYNSGDFEQEDSNLYATKKGAFFVAGSGGAKSRFSRSVGNNSWGGGSGVIPVDTEQAMRLAEKHGDTDVLEEFFSEWIEDA